MGTLHLLEVLHALLQLNHCFSLSPSTTDSTNEIDHHLPFPHFQQRIQQTLRGVLLIAVTSAIVPFVIVSVLPLGSTFDYSGLWVIGLLVILSLMHLVLRNVLFPYPCQLFRSDQSATVYGWTQTTACVLVDCCARLYQDPQIFVLLPLSIVLSWMWKSVAFALVSDTAANDASDHFIVFVVVNSIVSLVSFVWLEKRWSEDPFVLDPRSVLSCALQRDMIRALRRGILSWALARFVLVFIDKSESTSFSFFFPRFHRTFFHLMTNCIESFVLLSIGTVFRILLFRTKCSNDMKRVLWGSVEVRKNSGGLFALKPLSVSSQHVQPLVNQYAFARQTRLDNAANLIVSNQTQVISLSVEHMQSLEDIFQLTNFEIKSRFDVPSRSQLFSSEMDWVAFISKATSFIDEFTIMLQLLHTLTSQSSFPVPTDKERDILTLERSWVELIRFLARNAHQHPLMILNAHPHLATLRISSRAVPSKIKYFVAAPLQFAIRRLLIEESRRRVFIHAKVVHKSQQELSRLVCASRTDDVQGNVQHSIPIILQSLIECRDAIEKYTDVAAKMGNMNDIYVIEANGLATALDKSIYQITETFEGELASLDLDSRVRKSLDAYISYSR